MKNKKSKSRKSNSAFRSIAPARNSGRQAFAALLAIGSSFGFWPHQILASPAIQTGGNVSVNGSGGVINGLGDSGYFVQGGNLQISDATLTNFYTKGGNGSGGGAGMGGAIFVNSGAAVILKNVDIMGNAAVGGSGGSGTIGGTLNNRFNGGSAGTAGANGYTPTQTTYTDIGGTQGTKGYNGAFNASGFGGNGGVGGAGGNGGDRSASNIIAVTNATLDLAAWVNQLVADSANPFTANVAIGTTLSIIKSGIGLGDAIAATASFDKSLADGQIGLGGGGGTGGNAGKGGFGSGGGAGGAGGAGGKGGSNWSGSAYQGGAAGGDAGDGGSGGLGGFGAGGGKGGDGGAAGHGAGFSGNAAAAAVPDVTETKTIPAIYAQQYTDPITLQVVTVAGKDNLSSPAADFNQAVMVSDGSVKTVTISTVKTFAEQTVTYIKTPGSPAVSATSPGNRPDGLQGGGGGGGASEFGGGTGAGGAGNATQAAGGSGGNGMGGGIFVRAGGTLTIQGNGTIGQNVVRGGAGQLADTATAAGSAGSAAGSDIFMMTGALVTLTPGAGNVITINGSIADDSAATMSSAIPSGSGANLAIASGLVILNGNNTYSGQTMITGGVLQAQDGTGIYSDSNINFSGGVLQSNGSFTRLVGTDPSKVQWTGSGGFAAAGGDLTVSLNDGFSQAAATQTWASGSFVPDGSSLLFGSPTADSAVIFKNNINLNSGNRSILVMANLADPGNALAANVDTATLTGVLSNGSLTVGDATHTGILILTNANTYNGGTTINGGSLVLAKQINPITGSLVSAGSLYADGAVVANGTFDISQVQNQTIGDLSGSGLVKLGSNQLSVNVGDSTFAGSIQDGGIGGGTGSSLVKRGSGTLTLTGTNSYTGGTTINSGGTLALSGAGSLYQSGAMVANGTFDISQAQNQTIGDLSGSGQVKIGNKQLSFGTANSSTFSGTINDTGTGVLAKQGAGTFAFSGTAAVSTINVNAGNFSLEPRVLQQPNLAPITHINVASNATLTVNNNNTIQTLTSQGRIAGTATLTASSYFLNNGTVVNGKLGLGTIYSNGGVQINAPVAAGTIFIQTGNLTLAAPDVLSHSTSVDIASNANMLLTGGDQTILNLTGQGQVIQENNYVLHVINGGDYSGNGSSAGSLQKSGVANLNLTGTDSFAQGTTVQQGSLYVNGVLTSDTQITSGGTLGGSGKIIGNVINNGILAPGNSPGVLTFNGNYTENGTLQIEIGGKAGPGYNPSGHDQVVVSGLTTLNAATSTLAIQQYNGFVTSKGDAFQIINTSPGSIVGSFANITSDLGHQFIFTPWSGSVVDSGLLSGQPLVNAFPNLTDNQMAMLNGLRIANNQYDGGNLVIQLLQSSNPSLVFQKASPEAYAGFSDYGLRAIRAYSDNARNMSTVVDTEKYSVFGGYSGFQTGSKSSLNHADYDLSSNGGLAGIRANISSRFSAGLFGGVDNGSVSAPLLHSNVTGSVWGLFGEYAFLEDRSLLASGGFSAAFLSNDGSRITNTNHSTFKEINSTANEVYLDVQYVLLDNKTFTLKPELKFTYSTSSFDGFNETNQEISEALRIKGLNADSALTELAINSEWAATSKLKLNARIAVGYDFAKTSRDVTANFVEERNAFTVTAPGMGQTQVTFGVGANYNITKQFGVGVSYKGGYSSDAVFSNTVSCNFGLSF